MFNQGGHFALIEPVHLLKNNTLLEKKKTFQPLGLLAQNKNAWYWYSLYSYKRNLE